MLFLKRLWIMLTADRRRFGILCAVIGVGLLLWARIIVISNLPRTAIADPDETAAPDAETVAESDATDKPRPVIEVTLAERPLHDPFVISPAYFPRLTPDAEIDPDPDKSHVQPTEDPELVERRMSAQYAALVGKFRLEAVMAGGEMAVIDGRTFRVDDSIRASGSRVVFRLAEVRQRSVILEIEDRQFELRMSSPGRE